MIASFKVLLSHPLTLLKGQILEPLAGEEGDYKFVVPPPYQSNVTEADLQFSSQTSLVELAYKLGPNPNPQSTPNVSINGMETIQANVLCVNFIRSDFDRSSPSPLYDPPLEIAFSVANEIVTAFRCIMGAHFLNPLTPDNTYWRMDYANDDGSQLKEEQGKYRSHMKQGFRFSFVVASGETWKVITEIPPSYKPPVYQVLFLDALNHLPQIGPCIVLAFSAIEVLSSAVLEHYASTESKPSGIWEWINDRQEYWREPSISDKLDRLLSCFAQKTLKDEKSLWQSFKELKEARNSFTHTGIASIGDREISANEAVRLVNETKRIIDWLIALLPEEKRPITRAFNYQIQFARRLV